MPASGACQAIPTPRHYDYMPFTLGIDYKPQEDWLLYAKMSRGFRSGGFPNGGGADPVSYQAFGPEQLTTYEVGTKNSLLDNHLQLNLAAFYSHYLGIQQNNVVQCAVGVCNEIQNIGAADIYGLEPEIDFIIGDLRVTSALGWLHANLTEGPYVGRPFAETPQFTGSLGGDYSVESDIGTFNFHGDVQYRSTQYFSLYTATRDQFGNPIPDPALTFKDIAPYIRQNGYALVNAQISLELRDHPITLSLWAKNLTETHYYNFISDVASAGLGATYGAQGDPRTFGASVAYKF
jgi:iron complex outermembrane receptor protein